MWSVTTSSAPVTDRREQVVVEHEAQPLIPRVVTRLEVDVDGITFGQIAYRVAADEALLNFGA